MKIALIEPYYGGSHKAWADGYIRTSVHDVELISHDARFWKWRMHGGFLTLARELEGFVAGGWRPDVIFASSMMDVSAFAGAIRRSLPSTPIVTYFHESQFTYPLSPADKVDLTYQMKNWSSAAVSDLVVFNSEYHRSVFFEEAYRFLNTFPEDKHTGFVDGVRSSSVVLPVGVDVEQLVDQPAVRSSPPLIMWNQRWEHDKGPEELKDIVTKLIADDVNFEMAMCGEVFVSVPPTFEEVTSMLGERLIHQGFATRDHYEALLRRADVVVSTAHQEFFGIAVVEAIAAGAHPVLPDRLVYPERMAALGFDPAETLYRTTDQAANLISARLGSGSSEEQRRSTMQYDWSAVAPMYDEALQSVLNG